MITCNRINSTTVTNFTIYNPESKVHGANMGPIWGRQDPDWPHVGPMNFAIREHSTNEKPKHNLKRKEKNSTRTLVWSFCMTTSCRSPVMSSWNFSIASLRPSVSVCRIDWRASSWPLVLESSDSRLYSQRKAQINLGKISWSSSDHKIVNAKLRLIFTRLDGLLQIITSFKAHKVSST